MARSEYMDFDLRIERSGAGYTARVLNSPAGQAAAEFSLPFSDLELENFLLRVGRTRRGVRRLESPEMEAAKAFGGRLFQAVFKDEVQGCLRSSLDEASRQGAGVRIRLRLADVPELADVPWEYLYNPALNRFLVLSAETPLVRYMELAERIRPLAVKPPLRVLVMIASPGDYPPLDVEGEWTRLKEALRDLEGRGLVRLERLEPATLAALQRELRRGEYHIFHFIGHGAFDEAAQDGVLLLQDEEGRGRPVSGQYLGTLMHDERSLRLAVLNACEGARTSRADPFAGTAQSLVQQGVPAVIAMQFEITDEAAIAFTHEFYAALADGYPVDAALAEARKAIFARGNDVEWGTPVLYMRAPDGRIFDVEPGRERAREAIAPAPEPAASGPKRWLWAGVLGALVLLLVGGGGVALSYILKPAPTPEQTVALADTPTRTPAPPTPSATSRPAGTPTGTPRPPTDTPNPPTHTPTPPHAPAIDNTFGVPLYDEGRQVLSIAAGQKVSLSIMDLWSAPEGTPVSCATGFLAFTWIVREPYPSGGEDLELQRLIPMGGGRTETFASGSSGSATAGYCDEITLHNISLTDYVVEIRYASGAY